MRLYHRTTRAAAETIAQSGFKSRQEVWLTFFAPDSGLETKRENTLLLVLLDTDDDDLAAFEVTPKDDQFHQKWLVPADVVNVHTQAVHIVTSPEIIQEDLELKLTELRIMGEIARIAAAALRKYDEQGIRDPEMIFPDQAHNELISRRRAFEAKLVAAYLKNKPAQ